MKQKSKTIIGRQEFCDLPELGMEHVRARVDSGAKTTALHAYNMEVTVDDFGQDWVTFNTHPENRRRKDAPKATLPIIDIIHVTSSNGVKEERYLVQTNICLGDKTFATQMTLTSRHKMSFPILIGRNTIIKGKFLIDVAKGYMLGK